MVGLINREDLVNEFSILSLQAKYVKYDVIKIEGKNVISERNTETYVFASSLHVSCHLLASAIILSLSSFISLSKILRAKIDLTQH
mmetsp:Transcript_30244/g.44171  ORF Transcript_30244/g.44171 Transcript_30244/m.44171 type:complete len:86 (+) Transcript_30244:1081-1338(+)